MGQEAWCTARYEEEVSEGNAYLGSDMLRFRGTFRLSIPFKDIQTVEASDGRLTVAFTRGVVTFDLGPLAQPWAAKVRNPKGLLDKLGVKTGFRVAVVGIEDAGFLALLRGCGAEVVEAIAGIGLDMVFVAAEQREDLAQVKPLQDAIKRNGAIWVVAPKGRGHLKESEVIAAGREAGLVDVKVVSFSTTHTALKFVVPVARR